MFIRRPPATQCPDKVNKDHSVIRKLSSIMQSLTKAVFLYGSQVPDKTTWLDTAPSCLAPDFPVDYSSGSGFEAAAAFP